MVANLQRDRHLLPSLDAVLQRTMDARLGELAQTLAAAFTTKGRRLQAARAAVALALDFGTWRRLTEERLDDAAAADLMANTVRAAAGG